MEHRSTTFGYSTAVFICYVPFFWCACIEFFKVLTRGVGGNGSGVVIAMLSPEIE